MAVVFTCIGSTSHVWGQYTKRKGHLYVCNLQLWYVMRRQNMRIIVRIAKYYTILLQVYSKPYTIESSYIIPTIADVHLLHPRRPVISSQLRFQNIFLNFQTMFPPPIKQVIYPVAPTKNWAVPHLLAGDQRPLKQIRKSSEHVQNRPNVQHKTYGNTARKCTVHYILEPFQCRWFY